MRRAFTLLELVVAIAILAVVMAMSGVIFRAGIQSYRMAKANGEILRKFRVITDQLDRDLGGLCKEGEIFLVWPTDPSDPEKRAGTDRLMFFTKGDFQSYQPDRAGQMIRGNVARVSYMLGAKVTVDDDGNVTSKEDARQVPRRERMLQRTQHILIPPDAGTAFAIPGTDQTWRGWHNTEEHDRSTIKQWLDRPLSEKRDMLAVIMDAEVDDQDPTVDPIYRGSQYDPNRPEEYMHSVLCQGVGQLSIHGWCEPADVNAPGQRWMPDADPNDDGSSSDSELVLDGPGGDVYPAVLYAGAGRPYGYVRLGGSFEDDQFNNRYYTGILDADHFNVMPGLGRALKFTFTLYDSQELIPDGRTFTHIVYLDN